MATRNNDRAWRSILATAGVLLASALLAPAGAAQEANNSNSNAEAGNGADAEGGESDASTGSSDDDGNDRRSERRRRVERETAQWVEQILQEKREREARNAGR